MYAASKINYVHTYDVRTQPLKLIMYTHAASKIN